jgi:hypothetical protein
MRSGSKGQADSKIYEQALRRSKRSKADVNALVQQISSVKGKSLLKRKAMPQLFPAFLPDGVGTQGNTTGNVAEVSHRMFDAVRSEVTLFRCNLNMSSSPSVA